MKKHPEIIHFPFIRIAGALLLLLIGLNSCQQSYTPKPLGYFRIELPAASYSKANTTCPYSFDLSEHAEMVEADFGGERCWYDIRYQELGAELNLSYKELKDTEDLERFISETYKLSYKHTYKASQITEEPIGLDIDGTGGLLYRVSGNAASPIQFFLTDSSKHFLRVSLYFNCSPNYDSLKPVINFMDLEVQEMIKSFSWTS